MIINLLTNTPLTLIHKPPPGGRLEGAFPQGGGWRGLPIYYEKGHHQSHHPDDYCGPDGAAHFYRGGELPLT